MVRADAVAGVSFQQVEVEPVVDFGRLEFVNVLLRRGPTSAETRPGQAAGSTTTSTLPARQGP